MKLKPEVKELVEAIRENGADVEAGGKHLIVVRDGERVLHEGRPITLPSSPSDHRWRKNAVTTLVRAGVLKDDPKKAGQTPRTNGSQKVGDVALRREREQRQREVAGRESNWQRTRRMMDRWINKVGGWGAPGLAADLARLAQRYQDEGVEVGPGTYVAAASLFTRGMAVGHPNTQPAFQALARAYDADPDPRARWFDELRELIGQETPEAALSAPGPDEWPFEMLLLPIAKMFGDESYQRPGDPSFVRSIAVNFDPSLVGALDVSQRPGGKFAIMDGLQRREACELVGKNAVWCAVYKGLTVAQEAHFFFHKNRDRKAIHPYYHLRARIVAGDRAAQEIARIVQEFGWNLGVSSVPPDTITAIKSLESVYGYTSDVREEALTPTLSFIRSAWGNRDGAKEGESIRGFGRFFQVYGDDEIQWDHFRERLEALSPRIVLGKARDRKREGGQKSPGVVFGTVLAEEHNIGLPRADRLNTNRVTERPGARPGTLTPRERALRERQG